MFQRIYSFVSSIKACNFQEVIKLQNIYCGLFNNVIIIFLKNRFSSSLSSLVSRNFDNQIKSTNQHQQPHYHDWSCTFRRVYECTCTAKASKIPLSAMKSQFKRSGSRCHGKHVGELFAINSPTLTFECRSVSRFRHFLKFHLTNI